MSILIEIEDTNLETRNKKNGQGTYDIQQGFAHLTDRNGNPDRYPRKINIFPPKDPGGRSVPYKPGKYHISPASYQVGRMDMIELGYTSLIPVSK